MENSNQMIYTNKIKLKRIFYPKGVSKVNSGEFAIFIGEKTDTIEVLKDIKLKGIVCYLDNKSEYNVTYKLKEDNQYGKTYEIINIVRDIDIDSVDSQKDFFKMFLNDKIITELYTEFGSVENIKNILENENVESLIKIHGIGEHRAKRIISEYKNHKLYEDFYVKLAYLDLSPLLVKKIAEYFNCDSVRAIKTLNDDIYSLVRIKGIGFKKADEIASKSGISPTDFRRIKGFIIYYLSEQSEIGKSYITYQELCSAIDDNLGVIDIDEFNKSAQKLIDNKDIIVFDNGNIIALNKMYNLELNIYKELIRLNSYEKTVTDKDISKVNDAISISEDIQGFEFTNEQKQAIKDSIYHNVIAITGGAGCVDCDTEYLTPFGWKKISEYRFGDKVLQYNYNGSVEFVEPLRYIKQEQNKLWYVHNDAINMCLSANHNCVYINNDNLLQTKTFDQIAELHYKDTNKYGFSGRFITGFQKYETNVEINENLLILYTIIILRGKYLNNDIDSDKYLLCSVRVKELHCYKRNLLISALKGLGIKFVERNKYNGFSDIWFYMPERITSFPLEWYQLNNEQYKIIINVVRNYSNRHNTTKSMRDDIHFTSQWFYDKSIADFIQFAIASTGHRAEIIKENIIDNRTNEIFTNKYKYCVCWYNHILVDFKYNVIEKIFFNEYTPKDGYEYCFTVPSNMLVLRRKNKIFVTGNCGKTTTANGIFKVFDNNEVLACALSGKASVRIKEATGLEASTIHKTLRYVDGDFVYNENNQLECDCFLIDESTMVNGTLFLSTLKAIPTGATVIMCGDIKQLTPIGNCQVFYDILKYSNVQIIELTKPHRQALKSGIITTSLNISKQEQILSSFDYGTKIFGELQDMIVKIQDSNITIFNEIIKSFIEEYNTNKDIIETQIVLAVKSRGQVSCYNVNQEIQKIVNPINENNLCIEVFSHSVGKEKYYYKIQVGDKVINIKNNYHALNLDGNETSVFNGNIGIVKKITDNECIIDFIGIGEIIFEKKNWSNLELAYALTCHKVQGSGFNSVIVGLDTNSYLMNCSEWLYTAITRAKKKCILISTNNTIRNTIKQKETKKKQTFLGEFFKQNKKYFL